MDKTSWTSSTVRWIRPLYVLPFNISFQKVKKILKTVATLTHGIIILDGSSIIVDAPVWMKIDNMTLLRHFIYINRSLKSEISLKMPVTI